MKRVVLTALPLLVLAGMFGYQWRQNHPPISDTDVWLQQIAADMTQLEITALDSTGKYVHLAPGTGIRTSDRETIKMLLGTLRCEHGQIDTHDERFNDPWVCSIGLKGKNISKGLHISVHDSHLRLVRYIRPRPKNALIANISVVRPVFAYRFFDMVRTLATKAQHHPDKVQTFQDLSP